MGWLASETFASAYHWSASLCVREDIVWIVRSGLPIFFASTPRVAARGTPIRGDTATRHRVSPKTDPSAGRRRRRRQRRPKREIAAADLARDLSMKIDPELSGSGGISRVGRSPNLNAAHVDAIGSVDRGRTADAARSPADKKRLRDKGSRSRVGAGAARVGGPPVPAHPPRGRSMRPLNN